MSNLQNHEKKGKFEANWLGLFIITTKYGFGAYQIATLEGDPLLEPKYPTSQAVLCLSPVVLVQCCYSSTKIQKNQKIKKLQKHL